MKIYMVESINSSSASYHPTKASALEEAQMRADEYGNPVEIIEITTARITAEVLCNILGGWGGYSVSEQLSRRVWPTAARDTGPFYTEEQA